GLDRGADQRLALFQREIGVFLRLDAGGDHHGRAAVRRDVVDLPPQGGHVDREIGRERRQWRDDQPRLRLCHGVPPVYASIHIRAAKSPPLVAAYWWRSASESRYDAPPLPGHRNALRDP